MSKILNFCIEFEKLCRKHSVPYTIEYGLDGMEVSVTLRASGGLLHAEKIIEELSFENIQENVTEKKPTKKNGRKKK